MLGASIKQIPGWCADLNCAAEIGEAAWALRKLRPSDVESLKKRLKLFEILKGIWTLFRDWTSCDVVSYARALERSY